ncbi:hypothetical protein ES705_49353 [subsurface metagenome]
MSRQEERDKGLQAKRAELREINKRLIEIEESMEDLERSHEELVKDRLAIKTEIRFLGGKVPAGQDNGGCGILWALTRGRRLSDERP